MVSWRLPHRQHVCVNISPPHHFSAHDPVCVFRDGGVMVVCVVFCVLISYAGSNLHPPSPLASISTFPSPRPLDYTDFICPPNPPFSKLVH
ncbi:hypothetical protein VTJ04DRAFT_1403 [Mycothermus thermophilus]|uniref:uncharacterized protein n=1 Tax=Humicola insolens TaxID=85995 RepID=UPI0037447CEF